MKKTLITILKYAIGIGLLALVIWRYWRPIDGLGIADALQRPVQAGPLALAFACCTIGVILTFVRWYILVRAQELPFSMFNATRLGLLGYFFSTVPPGGTVAGDVLKAAFLAREQSRRTVAVATVLVDRAVGLLGLFWLVALLGSVFWLGGDPAVRDNVNLQWVVIGSLGILGTCVLGWLLLGILPERRAHEIAVGLGRLPKVGGIASELWGAGRMYRNKGKAVALTVLMSLVGHVFFVLVFFFAAMIFSRPGDSGNLPSITEAYVILPIGMVVQAVSPPGVGEFSFAALFGLIGKPQAEGALAALIFRMVHWILSFVGYLIALQMGQAAPAAASPVPVEGCGVGSGPGDQQETALG